jgi:hypothetical protein
MGHKLDTDGEISLRDGNGQQAASGAGVSPIRLSQLVADWDRLVAWGNDKPLVQVMLQTVGRQRLQYILGTSFEGNGAAKLYESGGDMILENSKGIKVTVGGVGVVLSSPLTFGLVTTIGQRNKLSLSIDEDGLPTGYSQGTDYQQGAIAVGGSYYDGTNFYISDDMQIGTTLQGVFNKDERTDQMQIVTGGQQVFSDTDSDAALETFSIASMGAYAGNAWHLIEDGVNDWDWKQNISSGTRAVPVFARVDVGGATYAWQRQAIPASGIPFVPGTAYPKYNSGFTSLVEASDGKYVNYFFFLTNCPAHPVIAIPSNYLHDELLHARRQSIHDFMGDMGNAGDHPFTRMQPLCRVTMRCSSGYTNSYGAIYYETLDLRYYRTGNWPYEPHHDALEGRMGDDAHPQYSMRDFKATAWTDDASPIDLSPLASRVLNFASKVSGSFTINLPSLSDDDLGSGHTVFLFNAAAGGDVTVNAASGDAILLPGTAGKTSVATSKYGSYCGFVGLPASNIWLIVDGNGEWVDDLSTPTAKYNWDGNISGGTEDNLVAIDAYGNIKDSDVAVESVERRWTEFSGTQVSSSTFTVDPTPEMIEKMRPGVPIKGESTSNPGYVYYHLVQSVGLSGTKLLVTVSGFEVSGVVDKWWYGTASMTEQRVISVPGNFNDADDSALIEHDLSTFMKWGEDDAYLIGVEARCITADSGADPTIQVSGGGLSLGSTLSVGSSWAYAPAGSWGQKVTFNDVIEIGVNKGAGNGDAQDLTVVLTVVKEKNDRSDFEPASDPSILMIISGMSPTTWCGLGDGAHILVPTSYTQSNPPTTATAGTATEKWTYQPSTSVQKLYFFAKAKGVASYGMIYSPTSAYSKVLLNNGAASPSYSFNNQYDYPGDPGPWYGRVRDRLMGATSFAGYPDALFTWSKLGKLWYNG